MLQFLSTNRLGDFKSRWTIVGELVCKQFIPLAYKKNAVIYQKQLDLWLSKTSEGINSYHIKGHLDSTLLIQLTLGPMNNSI